MIRKLIILFLSMLVTACRSVNKTTNSRDIQPTTSDWTDNDDQLARTSYIVGAKKRAIFVSPLRKDDPFQASITCAEPIPDALSAALYSSLAGPWWQCYARIKRQEK